MKKLLLSLFLFPFTLFIGQAQITMSHAAQHVQKEEIITPYDSTKNFLGNKNVKSYIGQLLYVNGKALSLQGYGYDDFKTEKEPPALGGRYGNPASSSSFNTKYEDLVGKYFMVVDVQPDSKQLLNKGLYGSTWWFLLQNRDNADETVWYKYDGEFEHSFPFITISHFNYLKNNMIGKKFISAYSIRSSDNRFISRVAEHDFYTGEEITQGKDDLWECIDVTIEDKYYYLVFIVKNQNGAVSTIHAEYINPVFGGHMYLFTEEMYNGLSKEYGADYMDLVRQSKIKVGMPEILLIMSWGLPEKINRSSSGPEQWVYKNYQYVYVEGGVITAWN